MKGVMQYAFYVAILLTTLVSQDLSNFGKFTLPKLDDDQIVLDSHTTAASTASLHHGFVINSFPHAPSLAFANFQPNSAQQQQQQQPQAHIGTTGWHSGLDCFSFSGLQFTA